MIVVSDTSPINYLVLIELQDLLPELFQRVLISDAVHRELQSTRAPDPIRRFLAEAPNWLEVRPSPEIDPALPHLDSGEGEAISLALSIGADWVYTKGDVIRGVWYGQLASRWGLVGEVREEHFQRLAEGQHPITGEQLVRHQTPRETRNARSSTAAARRVVKACKVLGIAGDDLKEVFYMLDYSDQEGNPISPKIERVW